MNYLYNEEYYTIYSNEKIPYSEYMQFFENLAKRIVQDFNPKTFLDTGCAYGYLVAALRDLGVEAYGIDISDFAISQVREDIRPYCVVGSLTDPLPKELPNRYDLIANLEVIEHMFERDGLVALSNICKYSNRIIFSSHPTDFTEKTHYNVQQIEYWSRHFAKEGFFRSLDYSPDYIAPQAIYFEKGDLNTEQIVENYEHKLRNVMHTAKKDAETAAAKETELHEILNAHYKEALRLQVENGNLQTELYNLQIEKSKEIYDIQVENGSLQTEIYNLQVELNSFMALNSELKNEKEHLLCQIDEIYNSRTWNTGKKLQRLFKFLIPKNKV